MTEEEKKAAIEFFRKQIGFEYTYYPNFSIQQAENEHPFFHDLNEFLQTQGIQYSSLEALGQVDAMIVDLPETDIENQPTLAQIIRSTQNARLLSYYEQNNDTSKPIKGIFLVVPGNVATQIEPSFMDKETPFAIYRLPLINEGLNNNNGQPIYIQAQALSRVDFDRQCQMEKEIGENDETPIAIYRETRVNGRRSLILKGEKKVNQVLVLLQR